MRREGQKVTHILRGLWLTGPVVIHAERDESQHRDVEADVPARIGSLYGILRIMSKDTHTKKRETYEEFQTGEYIPKPIPMIPLIQKEHSTVKHPRQRRPSSRPPTRLRNHIIRRNDREHLQGTRPVQRNNHNDRAADIKRDKV